MVQTTRKTGFLGALLQGLARQRHPVSRSKGRDAAPSDSILTAKGKRNAKGRVASTSSMILG